MAYLNMFNLIGFDANGEVCATEICNLNKSRSNFLYLVCKYNLQFLKEKGQECPEFFKESLSRVLEAVEQGANYKKARVGIAKYCLPEVGDLLSSNATDKAVVVALNEKMTQVCKPDEVLSLVGKQKCDTKVNKDMITYIITHFAGKVDAEIEKDIKNIDDPKSFRRLFKNIIKSNSLVLSAQKIQTGEISYDQFLPKAI